LPVFERDWQTADLANAATYRRPALNSALLPAVFIKGYQFTLDLDPHSLQPGRLASELPERLQPVAA